MPRFPLRVLTFVDREEKVDIEYRCLPEHSQVSYPGRLISLEVLQMVHYRHFRLCATLLMNGIILTVTLPMNNIVKIV